jgi:tetratricopeptide (TPR) repeat protein
MMGDPYSQYEAGLNRLLTRLSQDHPLYTEVLVLQQRLTENLARARRYGGTETSRAERAQIVDALNALALRGTGVSFAELLLSKDADHSGPLLSSPPVQISSPPVQISFPPGDWITVTRSYTAKELEEARRIEDADKRAGALAKIIPYLPASRKGEVLREALAAAREVRDSKARSESLTALTPHLREAVRVTGDQAGKAAAWGNLGLAYIDQGHARRAIKCYQRQLKIMRDIGDRRGEAIALGNLGNAYADLGDASRAIGYYEQMLAIFREMGDRQAEGEVQGNLGLAYAALGEFPRAIEHYEQAISAARRLNDRYAEAIRLQNLGLALLRLANAEPDQSEVHLSRAADVLRQAMGLFDTVGATPLLRAHTRYHLGRCYHQLGRWPEAIALLEQAREVFARHKARPELAHALLELGQLYYQTEDFESAYIYLKDALRLFRRLGDTDGIAVTQEALGSMELQAAHPSEAIISLREARRGYVALQRDERVRAVDNLLRMADRARQVAERMGATP